MGMANGIGEKAGSAGGGLGRRRFLAGSAAAAFGFQVVPRHVVGGAGQVAPSERVVLGCVGVGGQGGGVIRDLMGTGLAEVAALCDVDMRSAAGTIREFERAKVHWDYRRMLEEHKDIDAVMVATPDHMHAPVGLMAMRQGLHAYVEKPLAHSIGEARAMAEVAAEMGVVTQMGNQGHAGEGIRLTREWIQAGLIGEVKEVHSWSDRPGGFWDTQGRGVPEAGHEVPEGLDWDLWLGPAAARDFHPSYCPRAWRGWWDFGCGALGDMAVHNADPAFYALDLGAPEWVEARHSGNNGVSFPTWCEITYQFPAREGRGPVKMVWYDGGKKPPPPPGLEEGRELGDNGIYFVGDKGCLLGGGWSGTPRLVPEAAMREVEFPEKSIARSEAGHRREWLEACKAGDAQGAKSGFWYSAPFTENLLVGLLALRFEGRVEWDGERLMSPNRPEAARFVHKEYRDGFGVKS
jgi:predicted dehydrogenase